MGKPVSFICERTIEYSVSPFIKQILKENKNIVIPIFPWLTREGSHLSSKIHNKDQFRVLGVFTRRPKLKKDNTDCIFIKINQSIINSAIAADSFNIPLIATAPLAKNFWELEIADNYVWLNLKQIKTETTLELPKQKVLAKKLTKTSLLEFFYANSKLIDINTFIKSIRHIKNAYYDSDYLLNHFFIGAYKPIYFLVRE